MSETPESNPGALVVSSPKALAIANRQLRIAGQALARIEQERYIEFFATHPEASRAFVEAVSRYYPCSEAMIDRYGERWNWESLSRNENLPRSEALIERYSARWSWCSLSANNGLPWTEALIAHYSDRWDWRCVSETGGGVSWTDALIERYANRWDWHYLSHNWALPWTEGLI